MTQFCIRAGLTTYLVEAPDRRRALAQWTLRNAHGDAEKKRHALDEILSGRRPVDTADVKVWEATDADLASFKRTPRTKSYEEPELPGMPPRPKRKGA